MYHVGVSSLATMGRRFFNMGGIAQSLLKRDMFRVDGNLYQCNKRHMLIPYFARPLGFGCSSGQISRQETKKEDEKKCQIISYARAMSKDPKTEAGSETETESVVEDKDLDDDNDLGILGNEDEYCMYRILMMRDYLKFGRAPLDDVVTRRMYRQLRKYGGFDEVMMHE